MDNLGPVCPGGVKQGYSLPFVSLPPLSRIPVTMLLPCLRLKREALWEEVASPYQGGHGDWPVVAGPGEYTPITSWLPSALGSSAPSSTFVDSTRTSCFEVPHRDPQSYHSGFTSGLVDGVTGSQGWLPACADTSISLVVPLVCSQEHSGRTHCLPMEGTSFWLSHCPRVFTKILAPVAVHLHMQGCLMYPYTDQIFHAQASFLQACRTPNISLRCHFTLGFIVNLAKLALIPCQVMPHLGAMIDTARGILFPSPERFKMNVHAAQELLCHNQVSAGYLQHVTGLHLP